MEQTSDTVAPGGVVQVLQAGYELFGRIVRPAMVVVAAKDSTGQAAGEPAEAQSRARGRRRLSAPAGRGMRAPELAPSAPSSRRQFR